MRRNDGNMSGKPDRGFSKLVYRLGIDIHFFFFRKQGIIVGWGPTELVRLHFSDVGFPFSVLESHFFFFFLASGICHC